MLPVLCEVSYEYCSYAALGDIDAHGIEATHFLGIRRLYYPPSPLLP